jgi:hypothetical protein
MKKRYIGNHMIHQIEYNLYPVIAVDIFITFK